MKAIVLSVSAPKDSKHGGKYVRALFKDISEKNCTFKTFSFFCYLEHDRSSRFFPYLKPQAIFENLSIFDKDGAKFIDGNSNFTYLGQRHE